MVCRTCQGKWQLCTTGVRIPQALLHGLNADARVAVIHADADPPRACSTMEHPFQDAVTNPVYFREGTVVAERMVRTQAMMTVGEAFGARYLSHYTKGKMKLKMKKKFSFAAIAFALAMLVAAPVAQATTVSEVQSMITQLKGKVAIIIINGKQAETKDRPGLLGQLDGVALTLDQGKFCDSVKKVRDFQTKVNQMISADNKINQDPALGVTAQELIADGDAIIKALNDLAVQSTGSPCSN